MRENLVAMSPMMANATPEALAFSSSVCIRRAGMAAAREEEALAARTGRWEMALGAKEVERSAMGEVVKADAEATRQAKAASPEEETIVKTTGISGRTSFQRPVFREILNRRELEKGPGPRRRKSVGGPGKQQLGRRKAPGMEEGNQKAPPYK